jgi:NAD(P)-dependent dehydrogenase (short-subunit alcohol dehydrogenase family)
VPTDTRPSGLPPVDFRLDGKVAIVTGAAVGGIGEAYARALAGAGAAVVCADVNRAGADGVAEAITSQGGRALAVEVDIADESSVQDMVARTATDLGGVDILVNNAALMAQIVAGGPTLGFPPEMWDRAFDVNVKGAWLCARAAVPEMVKRGGGSIVNQSSIGAVPAESVYGITKLAVIGLTTTLARELGRSNINVNCIAPGLTQSDAGRMLTPDDSPYTQMMEGRAAMRARGQPSELCGALLLFTSPAGRWITGQVMVVDGGICLHV